LAFLAKQDQTYTTLTAANAEYDLALAAQLVLVSSEMVRWKETPSRVCDFLNET